MDYILGAGLLFGAVLLLALGRLALARAAGPADKDSFGPAEGVAFVFTVLVALGISMIGAKAFREASLASLAQMAGALAAAVAAAVATWTAVARLMPGETGTSAEATPADPVPPRGNRPRRPSGAGAEGARAARPKRAA